MHDDELKTGLGRRFDFEANGALPAHWARSTTGVPDGFLVAGGSAIVIERERGEQDAGKHLPAPREKRVLLALPDTSVDVQRAKWLSRRPGFNSEAASLSHLWRVKECKAVGGVVLEFDFPPGVPLSERLSGRPRLSHTSVQHLCRKLLRLVTSLGPAPLRLLGFMDASMVFLNPEDGLEALLPLGCILSFLGAQVASAQAAKRKADNCLAPELKRAMIMKNQSFVHDLATASDVDTYAIAALGVKAFGQSEVDRTIVGNTEVPSLARDWLQKALHHEADWRLSGDAALDHPWLKEELAVAVDDEDARRCVA